MVLSGCLSSQDTVLLLPNAFPLTVRVPGGRRVPLAAAVSPSITPASSPSDPIGAGAPLPKRQKVEEGTAKVREWV